MGVGKYLRKYAGTNFRAARARNTADSYRGDVEVLQETLGRYRQTSSYALRELSRLEAGYNHGDLTARQYHRLVRQTIDRSLRRTRGLEKILAAAAAVLIFGAVFLFGDMGSMALTGNAILTEGVRAASFSLYGLAFLLVAFLILFRHYIAQFL